MTSIAHHFVIEPMFSAQVAAHADLSARLIENFVKRRRHYDEVVIPEMRRLGIGGPEDRVQAGAWNAISSQLLATEGDLVKLMEDARQQGTEALRSRRGRSAGPRLDLTLRPPSSRDPAELAATVYVMWDGMRGSARDAADEIGRLTPWLSRCADPVAGAFAIQLEGLADKLRPPNISPGPYAPGDGEVNGPAQHAALLICFEATFTSSFKPQPELISLFHAGEGDELNFGPLAEKVSFLEDPGSDPSLFTLKVTYPADGQNDEEALRFATELFERDCGRHELPEPEKSTVTVVEAPRPG